MLKYLFAFFFITFIIGQNQSKDIRVNIIPHSPKDWDTLCYKSYKEKLNIYFVASTLTARVVVEFKKARFIPFSNPLNAMIGFRLNIKAPKFYQKFMNTKLYGWM